MSAAPAGAEWLDANRANWNERTPIHVASDFYDVQGFLAGSSTLNDFEIEEIGDVEGASLCHLQCHFGLDTLSWARRGARVVGLDFSKAAIAAARELTRATRMTARFVEGDVYDAASLLGDTFDIVYTGLGALNWLPDLDAWASVIEALLKPGGRLYLVEFHPLLWVLEEEEMNFDARWSYFFDPEGVVIDDEVDYADPSIPLASMRTYEWAHPLGEVVTALAHVGLRIELLSEHQEISYQRFPFLEEVPDSHRRWRIPPDRAQIPLEYSLRARKLEGARHG